MSSSQLPPPTARPVFNRSRSHTIPSNTSISTEEESTKPTRPPNSGRSNSYLSPVDPKPREAQTLPFAASTGGIVSYAQRHGQNRSQQQPHVRRHKHTQSDVHGSRRHGSDGLPHLTAGLIAERKRQDAEKQRASDFLLGPRAQELRRMASTRSNRQGEVASTDGRNDSRNELRRRATSDPKTPPKADKTLIEDALDRAYEKKLARIRSITQIGRAHV